MNRRFIVCVISCLLLSFSAYGQPSYLFDYNSNKAYGISFYKDQQFERAISAFEYGKRYAQTLGLKKKQREMDDWLGKVKDRWLNEVREAAVRDDSISFMNMYTTNNLAHFYSDEGNRITYNYAEAELLYQQLSQILKIHFGENSSEYITNITNLALVYEKLGQYEKGTSLRRKAQALKKKNCDILFTWPPPKASARHKISDKLLQSAQTFGRY